jgi:hypothetical protein
MLKEVDAAKDRLKGNAAALQQIDAVVGSPPPPLGSSDVATLLGLSDRIDTLADAVESADAAPTPDEVSGYRILSAALNAISQRWNTLKGELPAS